MILIILHTVSTLIFVYLRYSFQIKNCVAKQKTLQILYNVKWVRFHHHMACPQVADGGDGLQVSRVAANILKKQSQTANKGWSSSLEIWHGANSSSL
jgi:hypothetical protein